MHIGCSSSNEVSGAGGSGGGAGADGSSGGSGIVACDHVVSSDNDLVLGFGVALATDGTDVFVLKDKEMRRTVQVLRSGNLVDVVGVDNDPTNVYPGGASLVVTANGFFFDATSGGKRSIYRSSRAGDAGDAPERLGDLGDASGSTKPPFVADDTYIYMQAPAPAGDSLAQLSQQAPANSTGTIVSSGVFLDASFSSMAVTADAVFNATSGGGMVSLRASSKSLPMSTPPPAKLGVFALPLCEGSTVSLQPGSEAIFLGCNANDGQQTIYQVPLPSDWPPNGNPGQGAIIVSGIPINAQVFLVQGTVVYYFNESVPGLFRISGNDGGTPDAGGGTKIMASHGAKHMAADAQNIYVLSACGLQQAPL